MGADWGGRGVDSDSFTAFAVAGLRPDNKIEVPYATRIPPSIDDTEEVNYVSMLHRRFKSSVIGHDYRSQGMTKDTMIAQKLGGAAGPALVRLVSEMYSRRTRVRAEARPRASGAGPKRRAEGCCHDLAKTAPAVHACRFS